MSIIPMCIKKITTVETKISQTIFENSYMYSIVYVKINIPQKVESTPIYLMVVLTYSRLMIGN
jgi:hypothetical protein